MAGVRTPTDSMVRVSQQRAALGEDFNQLSGEDATVLGYMAHGGHGCISVTSNVAPRLCAEFHLAWQRGDHATALKVHDKLMPLHVNLFIESNPSPVKYALSLLGKIDETLRLPMLPVTEPTTPPVRTPMLPPALINLHPCSQLHDHSLRAVPGGPLDQPVETHRRGGGGGAAAAEADPGRRTADRDPRSAQEGVSARRRSARYHGRSAEMMFKAF